MDNYLLFGLLIAFIISEIFHNKIEKINNNRINNLKDMINIVNDKTEILKKILEKEKDESSK